MERNNFVNGNALQLMIAIGSTRLRCVSRGGNREDRGGQRDREQVVINLRRGLTVKGTLM